MRTLLQARHLPAFQALDSASIQRICERHGFRHVPRDGDGLFQLCQTAGLDHARTVLALARETDDTGVRAIETLVGRPITRWTPPAPGASSRGVVTRERNARTAPTSSVGHLVVLAVVPNPKKPGSASHDRFSKWVVGQTVQQCMAAGLTRGDVTWDMERGFVTLGEPSA